MYAIVDIQGQQFRVEKDQEIFVHRLDANEGDQLDFEKVMLLDNNGKVNVGAPFVGGAKITAKVLSHDRGDKVLIFKKKRRKGYQTLNGHRQDFTKILIEKITS
ncbi:MAG: 50S ribosomal protein L21 [Bacteroidota bacterium]